jgi:hypothetical protein
MPITNPFRKIRCPFCSEQFHLGDCAIISETKQNAVVQVVPQDRWQKMKSHVWVKSLEGRENTLNRTLRECPKCRKLLPFNIEYVDDNISIAVIGDSFSGKSHYIAATIKEIDDGHVPSQLGLAGFTPASSGVEELYSTNYYEPLFKFNRPLSLNPPAKDPLSDPLIYEMLIAGKRINLLIYDASGEDVAEIDRRIDKKPHILNAQAMIFIADPWSMPGFVSQLAHYLRPDEKYVTGRRSTDILNRVIQIFKRASKQVKETEFSLPVSIALSKSDLIPYVRTRSADPRYDALIDHQFPSLLTREESEGINATVKQFLTEIGENNLVAMEKTLLNVNFSAFSATGTPLNDQGKYPLVEPHRCLDPLFWVLRELEVIE